PRRGRPGPFRPGRRLGGRDRRERTSRRHSGPLRTWAGRLSGLPSPAGPGDAIRRAADQRSPLCGYEWPLTTLGRISGGRLRAEAVVGWSANRLLLLGRRNPARPGLGLGLWQQSKARLA